MADNNRPPIGSFRGVPDNKPRTTAPSVPPTFGAGSPPEPPRASETKEQSTTTPSVPKTLTPGEQYLARLDDAGITKQEAEGIYDAVLSKGYYEEYVRIRGNKAVLRTRQYEDTLRVQTALELAGNRMPSSNDELIARYNLAASLYEWQGKPIRHNTDEDFDNAIRMIQKMPGPLVYMLTNALARFDAKLMVVFSEGCTEVF